MNSVSTKYSSVQVTDEFQWDLIVVQMNIYFSHIFFLVFVLICVFHTESNVVITINQFRTNNFDNITIQTCENVKICSIQLDLCQIQ